MAKSEAQKAKEAKAKAEKEAKKNEVVETVEEATEEAPTETEAEEETEAQAEEETEANDLKLDPTKRYNIKSTGKGPRMKIKGQIFKNVGGVSALFLVKKGYGKIVK
jgi:hypothetical protein